MSTTVSERKAAHPIRSSRHNRRMRYDGKSVMAGNWSSSRRCSLYLQCACLIYLLFYVILKASATSIWISLPNCPRRMESRVVVWERQCRER